MLQSVQESKYRTDPTTLEIMGIHPPAKVCLPTAPVHSWAEKYSDFFRQEGDGVLVYDSQAIIVTQPVSRNPAEPAPPQPPVCNFKEQPTCYLRDQYKFSRLECVSPQKQQRLSHTLIVPRHNTLRFDSQFESGNLKKAVKVTEDVYELSLEFDTNTQGYTHWFYFQVTPYRPNHTVTFRITNLLRPGPLYNRGFKPLTKVHERWTTDVQQVSYSANESANGSFPSFTLSFQYTFKSSDAPVYFAYCYPYTYSEMIADLQTLANKHTSILRLNTLCTSLGGNPVPVLTITQNVNTYTSWAKEQELLKTSAAGRRLARKRGRHCISHPEKKAVILTARVHPGETVGSHMLDGALAFLLGSSREAQVLRHKFVFKVVPMLNPDGVIWGNSRCSLLGIDLNRRWKHPHPKLHPVIYHCKRLIQLIAEEREIVTYCDMHGHSLKRGAFTYGCAVQSYDFEQMQRNLLAKLVPYLLYQKNEIFNYNECRFRVEQSKEHTARVVLYNEANIVNSYTLESTFYAGPDKPEQLTTQNFGTIGADFLRVLLVFCQASHFRQRMRELWEFCRQQMYAQGLPQRVRIPRPSPLPDFEEETAISFEALDFSEFAELSEFEQICGGVDNDSGGSDSNPSDEEPLAESPVCHLLTSSMQSSLRQSVRATFQHTLPRQRLVSEKPTQVRALLNATPKGASLKPRVSCKESAKRSPLPLKFKKLQLPSRVSPQPQIPSKTVHKVESAVISATPVTSTIASGSIVYQPTTPSHARETGTFTPIKQAVVGGLQEVFVKPATVKLANTSGGFRKASWVHTRRQNPKQGFLTGKLREPGRIKRMHTHQEERLVLGNLIKLGGLADYPRLT